MNLRFLIRHPVLIFFVLALLGLTYAVFNALQPGGADGSPGRGGPPGMMGGGGGNAPRVPVEVVEVRRDSFTDQVESVATTSALESVDITAKVSDTVSRVHFQDGDVVEAGDILLELTNTAEAARLSEARSTASEAERQYQRVQSLADSNLVSSSELEEAKTRWETAEARLEGIMANMEDRLIRAPFSGMLGFREVSEGSMVSPGTVITTLDDVSVIRVDFTVAESWLAQVGRGQLINARSIVYGNREFAGEVRTVGSRIDPVTRSVQVRAHIDNSDLFLRPGMLLTVDLALNESEVVVVPEQAVVPSQGRQYVFVVDGESVARRVEVEIGRRRPGLVEVLSGVEPGQQVVTLGIGQVRPDQPVQVLNSGMRELSRPELRSGDAATRERS